MASHWIESVRYHNWANLKLLGVCAKLDGEQLQLTAPGTYGTVAATWHHLLAAEQRYLARLLGDTPQLSERDPFPGIAALKRVARKSGERLLLAASTVRPTRKLPATVRGRQYTIAASIVLVQAIHHGNDHRTNLTTILGSAGIALPGLDVWAFGEAGNGINRVRKTPA